MLPRLKFWHEEKHPAYTMPSMRLTALYFFIEVDGAIRYARTKNWGKFGWLTEYVEHSKAEPHPLMKERS